MQHDSNTNAGAAVTTAGAVTNTPLAITKEAIEALTTSNPEAGAAAAALYAILNKPTVTDKPTATEDTVYDINGNEVSKGSAVELVLKAGRKPVMVAKGNFEDLNRDDKAFNDPVCKKKVKLVLILLTQVVVDEEIQKEAKSMSLWQPIYGKSITAGTTNLYDVKSRLENGVKLPVQEQVLRVVAIKQEK